VQFDGALLSPELSLVPELVRRAEEVGYDAVFTFEGPHEPFLPLVLAAEHSKKLGVATGLAIAFARTPMTVANLAHDLQLYSEGRLILGLGTQIKPHVERRYGMPWGKPLARMREFVLATKAIFRAWNEGEKLDFKGEYYTHTLMPPLFKPSPSKKGPPPIYLGGVSPKATAVAGEVAEGLLVHPFHTERYLREVSLPAIDEGRARVGKTREGFVLSVQALIGVGTTDEDVDNARSMIRNQIAFYASTPAYAPVLELEGFGALQPMLQQMTREGRWVEMADQIPDELLERVAILGKPKDVAQSLRARYGDIAHRIAFASPFPVEDEAAAEVIRAYRAG
jgi:probable F420-dependent oxidoreductase